MKMSDDFSGETYAGRIVTFSASMTAYSVLQAAYFISPGRQESVRKIPLESHLR